LTPEAAQEDLKLFGHDIIDTLTLEALRLEIYAIPVLAGQMEGARLAGLDVLRCSLHFPSQPHAQ
jgi:hypothetical protein